MFKITKSKGSTYHTDDLQSAIQAYTGNKRSLTMWQNDNVILTRIEFTKLGNLPIWMYLTP